MKEGGLMNDAKLFKALSEPMRIEILKAIKKEETCACDVLRKLPISQPTLSHHMKVLVEAGLVHVRKDGSWMRYSLNEAGLMRLKTFFYEMTEGDQTCLPL